MLRIRRMRRDDVRFAVQLTNQEKWGIPQRDFRRILKLDPRGSFVATDGMRRVGLATTTSYGTEVAWIGNIVVQKRHRGKHIGQSLVAEAVGYLHKKRVKHVALYCFDENVEFYKKLGFVKGAPFGRLRRERKQSSPAKAAINSHANPDLSSVLTIDKKAFGADRSRLIRDLLHSKLASVLTVANGDARAYLLIKNYEDMCELGPWVSFRASRENLTRMLRESLTRANGKAVEVSTLLHNERALGMLSRHGFQIVTTGHSMYLDEIPRIGFPAAILALGFLDKG